MEKRTSIFITIIVIGVFMLIGLWSSIFFTLQAGHAAVIFKPFAEGIDKENVLYPGFHYKLPWNTTYVYDVRENKLTEKLTVLDNSGLNIEVDVTIRFIPIPTQIGYLHNKFGKNYTSTLIEPEVRSAVRKAMGTYNSEEIYSTKRGEVESDIMEQMSKNLKNNHVELRQLLIRGIKLPDQIVKAIENKRTQEQEAEAHKFKLQKEKIEAQRKKIMAEGEATANQIINKSLTDKLLKMRGIEATIELSKSTNAKTVVIGSGKDGLPLILGNN